eukprot:1140896-Pelagomonas_calceolata.AAC.5
MQCGAGPATLTLEQLAWRALSYACMREQGMVWCRKVSPQTLHINATSVSGRPGFANFSALATLPSLVSKGPMCTVPQHTKLHA